MTPLRALILMLLAPLLVLPGAASLHLCMCAWLGCASLDDPGQDCCSKPIVAVHEAPACPFCEESPTPSQWPADEPSFQDDCGNCRDLVVEGLEPFDGPASAPELWVPTAWVSVQGESERRWERSRYRLPVCRPPPLAVERGRGLPLRI